jgi:hypothetical protein
MITPRWHPRGKVTLSFVYNRAGFSNQTGAASVNIGYGDDNIKIGHWSGRGDFVSLGDKNIMLGNWSGYSTTTGDQNIFIGHEAGYSNSSDLWVTGDAAFDQDLIVTGDGLFNNHLHVNGGVANTTWTLEVNGAGYIAGNFHADGYGDFDGSVYTDGSVYANGTLLTSDALYKKDIFSIQNASEIVNKINGVYYNWKSDEFPERKFTDRREVGVIAQEVEKVLPEVVFTDESGYKSRLLKDYSRSYSSYKGTTSRNRST